MDQWQGEIGFKSKNVKKSGVESFDSGGIVLSQYQAVFLLEMQMPVDLHHSFAAWQII